MTVCQCILLPLFMHQQINDIVCQGILLPLFMHEQNNDIVCQGILLPLFMHQQNNDIQCSMSRHFISTQCASTKQWQYVKAFYFHSVCINKTMTVWQGILLSLCASTEPIVIADVCRFNVLICLFYWTIALAQTFMYKPK